MAAQGNADLLHLLRPHVVCADDEAFRVFFKQLLKQNASVAKFPKLRVVEQKHIQLWTKQSGAKQILAQICTTVSSLHESLENL